MEKKSSVEPIVREARGSAKLALIIVAAGAFCLGLAFLALTLGMTSCSAQVASAIKSDGSARITVEAEIPSALATKIRKLSSQGQGSFFDARAIRDSLAARPGIEVLEASQPKPDAIRVVLSVRSLEELAASPDLKSSGLLAVVHGPGWTEFRFRLERGNAKVLFSLFPGIDPDLVDALSPPALEEDPVSQDDYTTMLTSVLGEKTMPALEAASIKLSISAPGSVLTSGGGTLSGTTLSASLPLIELLALEKPQELQLRWKNAS